MNIVIVGAGSVGLYLATLLSEKNNIILIDNDREKLTRATLELDIAIREGLGSDWQLLEELLEMLPDLLIAVTNNDEVNLVACMLARQLGYPRTICRVKDHRFLNRSRLDFARLFSVDYFISPELLVAHDIYRHLIRLNSLEFQSFAHGALQMRILKIPSEWSHLNRTLKQLNLPQGVIIGLIVRNVKGQSQIIFPRGDDLLYPNDEVVFLGEPDIIATIPTFFGLSAILLESVLIVGGSVVGVLLAKLLKNRGIEITIVDSRYSRCQELAKELTFCRVIHHDGMDIDFLLTEKLVHTGYAVACTSNDETNVLSALMMKKAGCEQVAVVLSDDRFAPLSNELGFVQIISPQAVAAEQIVLLATSLTITSLISLYDHRVEIIELMVTMNCKIIGIPLADVSHLLPKDFLIVMIQNRGQTSIAKGDSVVCPGDTVIVICPAKSVKELHRIF